MCSEPSEARCQVVFDRQGMRMRNGCLVVFELKGRIALQAGHASPVKWCLNEKVEFLCKLAMPCLSSGI